MIARLRAFAASSDGSLLDGSTWSVRHRRITELCFGLATFVCLFAALDRRDGWELFYPPVLLVLLAVVSASSLPRRAREIAAAGTLIATQVFLSRYVGNFTGLGAIAIIILSFYQDWVPILFSCTAAACQVVSAAFFPAWYHANRGFQTEGPITGMALRALAIALAAALTLAVWRYGTQLARDQLTGMLSRAGAERALEQRIARGRRPVAWVCDLDNFVAVNAELGSAAGDRLLQHVASQLSRVAGTLPNGSVCARLRADTFLVAMHDDPGEEFVEKFAHRIEAEAGVPATSIALDDVPVRLSVGAATAVRGESAAELIRTAERAMRRAKGQGNVRVVIESSKRRRRSESNERAASLLIGEIYRGIERREFGLHFQPIVSITDGHPVGAEALVRWNHPSRGMVKPSLFLPEAERDSALMAELSTALGMQFVETVARWIEVYGLDWLPYGYTYNLAAIRFKDPTLVRSMRKLVDISGHEAPERKITLEVTEGALMDIEHQVPEMLSELREQGYKIALDDFGVGHSSLAHLRDFPLDAVKIDQSFAQSVDRSPTDRAVVQAVSDIADASGLQLVAEGVETEEQREVLMSVNPEMLGQGWLFAKPLAPEQFELWVQSRKRTFASSLT